MRSRASQARALFRVATHSSSNRPIASVSSASVAETNSSASASASSSSSTPSSSTSATRVEHHGRDISSRRAARLGKASMVKRMAARLNATSSASTRSADSLMEETHLSSPKIVTIRALSEAEARLAAASKLNASGGIVLRPPVRPPPATLSSVASEAFFASHRPLLQHGLMSDEAYAKWTPQMTAEYGLESAKRMLEASLSSSSDEASLSSPSSVSSGEKRGIRDYLSTILESLNKIDGYGLEMHMHSGARSANSMPIPWRRPIGNLSAERFNKLLDSLSKEDSKDNTVVEKEASLLDEEEAERIDREQAIAAALERGEDVAVASSLGSEADLIILGEPAGPNPKWARGVATHLAENTRALQPPPPPALPSVPSAERSAQVTTNDEEDSGDILYLGNFVAESFDSDAKLPEHFLAEHEDHRSAAAVGSGSSSFGEDDNPTLLFSHALLQSHLPKALQWDALVDKMDRASISPAQNNEEEVARQGIQGTVVDVTKLNADLAKDDDASVEGEGVHMDSVKRKRKKKMRKHKYRKLRKRTRVERTRLKK